MGFVDLGVISCMLLYDNDYNFRKIAIFYAKKLCTYNILIKIKITNTVILITQFALVYTKIERSIKMF